MPPQTRQKRPLAEVNTNVISKPAAKRAKGSASASKPPKQTDNAQQEKVLANRELIVAQREESITRREQYVAEREQAVAQQEHAVALREEVVTNREKAIAPPAKIEQEFITFRRPDFDAVSEISDLDSFNDDKEAVKRFNEQYYDDGKKYNFKPLEEFPGHKWTMSRKGKELLDKYALQSMKRDQDAFCLYVYNDFTSYGEQEVVENMISDFTILFRRRIQCPYALWSCIEAIQWYMTTIGPTVWSMTDYGECFEATANMLCYVMLAALGILERQKLLTPNSAIPNISLTVALFFRWFEEFAESNEDDEGILGMIMLSMKENNVPISGLHSMSFMATYEDFPKACSKKHVMRTLKANAQATVDKYRYVNYYQDFANTYGKRPNFLSRQVKIGGSEYDITKMTKTEREGYSYTKKDPMIELSPALWTIPPELL